MCLPKIEASLIYLSEGKIANTEYNIYVSRWHVTWHDYHLDTFFCLRRLYPKICG